uniref:Uncharacterized protein n=1 Tax=Eptatretus burgeri TaxID=7764 RepID=A0A8C4R2X7_EPTBU
MSNNDALRLTSLQLDTGGIVHPRLGLRIPIQIALVRGLLQKDMAEKLSGSDSTSGFYLDPSTNIRFSYKQLLDKCVIDRETGLLFLPVQARIHERRPSQTSSIRRSRVLIIDPTDNSQLTPYEAYCKEIIDLELYAQLSGKESEWEEVVTTDENGVVKSELFDRETGVRFNVDAALAKGLIDKQKLDHFRSGKMSPTEFVALLSKTSSKPYRLSPGLIPQSPNHNGHSSSSAGGELHSINKTTVAGIMDLQSLEKITISESMKRNLVDTITGQRLLEAQACTGGIISPFTGQRFSLQDAQLQGLIETSVAERITLAQRAYTGYENPKTGIWMSTAEAMCSGRLPYETGQRFLQAQVLTGGLVEPNTPGRVSLDEAERKGSIDARTARKLRDMSTCAQCLTCPKTKLKISLKEAIESSMIDPVTGLSFLEASATSTRGLPSPYSVHDGHSRSTSGRRTHSFSSSSDRQTPSPVRRRPSSPSYTSSFTTY